jgi:ribosomal protein S20
MRNTIKKISSNKRKSLLDAIRAISKAASKGVIHKKNASNRISQIMRKCSTAFK